DPDVFDRQQQQAASDEECSRRQNRPLRPSPDELAQLILLEAIGKDLLAAARTAVNEHRNGLAPLHIHDFALTASVSDLHCWRAGIEEIEIFGLRAAPAIPQIPDQRVRVL